MEIPFYHDDVLSALAATAGASPTPGGSSNTGNSLVARPFPDGRAKKDGPGAEAGVATTPDPLPPTAPVSAASGSGDSESSEAVEGPDLALLKLSSPDLERLIVHSNGLIPSTGNSNGGSAFPFPKNGPDEQEFAAGFVKALEHLQHQLGPVGGPPAPSSTEPPPVYANLSTYGAAAGAGVAGGPFPSRLQQQQPPLKDEPQIVPEVASFGVGAVGGGAGVVAAESPPLSPIDMDTQERIKAERKRLRNRIAASKCRRRKLERISRLEEKVKSLKSQNTELASTANLLREQVAQLKQKVLSHVNSGCQLLPHSQGQPQPPSQPHQVPAY
ncbi:transcription factor jun-D-like [Sceloporus undulatus]|uniref:transcription factor jun-D-like n=1 Tax=Sceloporus undulatus TaxID=8520 RepID=UPI001C4CC665|nr:transcription factor jun-D-like [Sceloporus undulatus]